MTNNAGGAPDERAVPRAGEPATGSPVGRAIVAGHGEFAVGVVSAVAQITGRGDVFVPLSNRGLGADDIERAMREQADAFGARVVFTDLPAGSCTIAARRLQRDRPDLVLVTGANLATLLDFVFHADAPPAQAAQHAAEKGRASLAVVGATGGR
ncbi:MAG: PTS sugar transporter subunit IIA [Gemmatimonadaceae bacterium]